MKKAETSYLGVLENLDIPIASKLNSNTVPAHMHICFISFPNPVT